MSGRETESDCIHGWTEKRWESMCWGQNRPGIVLTQRRHEIGKTNCKGASCRVFLFEIYWGLYEAAECEVQMVTIMVMGTTCLITLIWPTPFWPPKIWGKKTGRHSISYDDTTKVCLRGFGAEYGLTLQKWSAKGQGVMKINADCNALQWCS